MRKISLTLGALAIAAFILAGYRVHLVHELRKPLLVELGQPRAVQFRNEIYLGNWSVSGGTLCGEVALPGAKGSGGGYQWFSVAHGVFVENESLRKQFNEAGIKRCNFEGRPAGTPWWWLHW